MELAAPETLHLIRIFGNGSPSRNPFGIEDPCKVQSKTGTLQL